MQVPSAIVEAPESAASTAEASAESVKGLRANTLNLFSNTLFAVASVAPAYSLAVTLGFIVAAVGLHAPFIIIVSFVPMLLVSSAFYYMNKADPDCGQQFIWTTRAFGPQIGWAIGFIAVFASVIVIANLVQVASLYMLEFLNFNGSLDFMVNSTFWVTFVGCLWIVGIAAIVAMGIELSALTQKVFMFMQMGSLFIFATWALVKAYIAHPAGWAHVYLAWFSWHNLSWAQVTTGVTLCAFMYWGWDAALSVNEESKDARKVPGLSAVISTITLVCTFVFVAVACQAFAGKAFLTTNAADVFTPLVAVVGGPSLAGRILFRLVMLAIFTSGAASFLTTLLPLSRSTLSMAAHGSLPKAFARVNPRSQTPVFGTIAMAALGMAWYITVTILSTNILYDAIAGLGIQVAFTYGAVGICAAVYFRRELFKSARNFFLIGLAPVIGAIILFMDVFYAGRHYWDPANSLTWPDKGIDFFGTHVGVTFVLGIGTIALAFVVMFTVWPFYRAFFSRRTETWPGEGVPLPHANEALNE
jgi:amino acid transporter